jgi:hypothetical protein
MAKKIPGVHGGTYFDPDNRPVVVRDESPHNPFKFNPAIVETFPTTPDQIGVLHDIEQAGGKIDAEEILTSPSRREAVDELRENDFVAWYGDAGLLRGYELTTNGRALLQRLRGKPEWSDFRTPAEWRDLRKTAGLSHSERTWGDLRKKHPADIHGEPGNDAKSCRITRSLAEAWGLSLPEFTP